jgi:hypothetical protein
MNLKLFHSFDRIIPLVLSRPQASCSENPHVQGSRRVL